jgi:hypothetical protein
MARWHNLVCFSGNKYSMLIEQVQYVSKYKHMWAATAKIFFSFLKNALFRRNGCLEAVPNELGCV